MAPGGRPSITIGIQPQIALYTVILGSVCAFGWYTEKYRRDEDDIDGQIKRMYVSDIKEAHEKLPQMTATIRGQDVRLDDRMNKLVWGGKAHMEGVSSGTAFGGGFGGSGGSKEGKNDDQDDDSTIKPERVNIAKYDIDDDDSTGPPMKKKRKKRKRRKATLKQKEENEQQVKDTEPKKFVVPSTTVVGISVVAVAVAGVTLFAGRMGAKR